MAQKTGAISRLKAAGALLKREVRVYRLVLKHERTPILPKLLLAVAVGYVLMPFDLIPDFIPVIGHLDDAIIVPALVILALKMVPPEVVDACRETVGIESSKRPTVVVGARLSGRSR